MGTKSDEEIFLELAKMEAEEADQYASKMDSIWLDISEMNLDACPPDRRFYRNEKEAWVYEHGNIAELVFVKVN
ncbi:MAG: hypothetical protein AAF478_10120 [Pseudomonadota bacterium]